MNSNALTILLVEDNPGDARLVRAMLDEASRLSITLAHVARLGDALEHLHDCPSDVVLLDLSLPDAQGLETVTRLHTAVPHMPIVVMSGCDDEALAVEGVRSGAQDYLVKGRVDSDLLVRSLRYAIERQRADDRLMAQAQALEAKTREQDAFIYTVSHDLKTPLVSLQGMAGILAEEYADKLDDEGQLYIRRISANAARMQILLTDLLEISRIGRADTTREAIDLAEVVAEVTEQLRHTLGARHATVDVGAGVNGGGGGPLPTVWASRVRMYQVFTNLIDNAVKYTPAARAPRIEITAHERVDSWAIAVRDNGAGIPPAYHEKVFGIFQRLPDGKALYPDGNGVGLAIVARIIDAHGGALWLESDGAGTTFFFSLPKHILPINISASKGAQ